MAASTAYRERMASELDSEVLVWCWKLSTFASMTRFVCQYDFHCAWFYDIRFEKIAADTEPQPLTVCIVSVGGGPPEDSGPADRFMEALDDHLGEDFIEWVEDLLEKAELDRSELCEGLEAWRRWIDRHFDRRAATARLRGRRAIAQQRCPKL